MPDTPLGWDERGFAKFQRSIEKLEESIRNTPYVLVGHVGDAIDQALMLLQSKAAVYPPAPSGSTYRRTGTLGRLWTSGRRVVRKMDVYSAHVVGRVGNATPYVHLVQDPDEQTWYHARTGWQTTEQVAEDTRPDLERLLAQAGEKTGQKIADSVK